MKSAAARRKNLRLDSEVVSMRTCLRLLAIASLILLPHASATAADRPPPDRSLDPAYGEIAKTIRGTDLHSRSARLELSYAERCFVSPTRKSVKTTDGKTAEIALIEVPAVDMPGTDFTMAILMIDGRAVDWASCWTSNRNARQRLCLEDVDGDGFVDVAFQSMKLRTRLRDRRQNRQPDDKRTWLAAYRVTSQGLERIFPVKERTHRLKMSVDNTKGPIAFHVTGLPESLPESEMVECRVSATNTSQHPVDISADQFYPEFDEGGGLLMGGLSNKSGHRPPSSLRPGQTVTQSIALRLDSDVTLRWSFRPKESLLIPP
jgi:hypothetical protein